MGIEPTRRQHESSMHGGFICCLGVRATTRKASSPARARVSPTQATYTYGAHLASSAQLICAHLGSFSFMQSNEGK
jgi:hypothetical protein